MPTARSSAVASNPAVKRIAIVRPPSVSEEPEIPERYIATGFELGVVAMRASALPADSVAMLLNELATVEACTRARMQGYDGILVAGYGLASARAAVSIPVVGTGQASMLTAASLGRRFSVVTIWPPSTAGAYRSSIESAGIGDMFAGVRHVTVDADLATLSKEDNFYVQMRSAKKQMIERLMEQIDAAVREDGADAIVLGCNCMTPVADALAAAASVPVIELMRTGYKALEMLVSLGLSHSPVAYKPVVSDSTAMLSEMIDVAARALDPKASEKCDVCVIGEGFLEDETTTAG